jgi:hypothetical protein
MLAFADPGLDEAVIQSTQIGAIDSWLRNQPAGVVSATFASIRHALAPHSDGTSARLPGVMWPIRSAPACARTARLGVSSRRRRLDRSR